LLLVKLTQLFLKNKQVTSVIKIIIENITAPLTGLGKLKNLTVKNFPPIKAGTAKPHNLVKIKRSDSLVQVKL